MKRVFSFKKLLLFLVALIIICASIAVGVYFYLIGSPNNKSESKVIYIEEGSSYSTIATKLRATARDCTQPTTLTFSLRTKEQYTLTTAKQSGAMFTFTAGRSEFQTSLFRWSLRATTYGRTPSTMICRLTE